MANPMHCDAQRNALGLSLQSIAFFPAPNCSEISMFLWCAGKRRKYAILSEAEESELLVSCKIMTLFKNNISFDSRYAWCT